ncbi:MAG TPA: GreA/GreB family elongation factor [Candidatus Saccharimonadales bacterium]|nr:GreA/GreB family elongation factor [Candidatus Saccharimonadales bacterium]
MKEPKKIIFTRTGYHDLQNKYDTLLSERVLAVEQLKKAREMGDLSENGFYKAAKQKLGALDHQIFRTKHFLRYGIISDTSGQNGIQIGNIVHIDNGKEQKEIIIVGEQEANPSEKKISFRSPLGKGLLNKQVGETVEIQTPRGNITYKIVHFT